MRDAPDEAIFEAEAPGQSRCCAGAWRRGTGSFPGGKRISIRSSDRRRSAISGYHSQSTLRSWRRRNGRRESCDIPPLRQGKRHRRLHAAGARLRLRWMRWMPWLWRWRWISWLWWRLWPHRHRRRMSWLWLQRLRLRRLRLRRRGLGLGPGPSLGRRCLGRRLWLGRLLRIVGCLPSLLIRVASHVSSDEASLPVCAPNRIWRAPLPVTAPRSPTPSVPRACAEAAPSSQPAACRSRAGS
jgi:hypothetical protein